MVVATKKLHGCAFELFLSLHLFETWSLRKGNGSKQEMKSNQDKMEHPDSLDPGVETFLLYF
jgi:hypothetical protein